MQGPVDTFLALGRGEQTLVDVTGLVSSAAARCFGTRSGLGAHGRGGQGGFGRGLRGLTRLLATRTDGQNVDVLLLFHGHGGTAILFRGLTVVVVIVVLGLLVDLQLFFGGLFLQLANGLGFDDLARLGPDTLETDTL